MDENSLLYPVLCHAARCQCLLTENHSMEILGTKPAWPLEVPSHLFARYGTMLGSKAKEKYAHVSKGDCRLRAQKPGKQNTS